MQPKIVTIQLDNPVQWSIMLFDEISRIKIRKSRQRVMDNSFEYIVTLEDIMRKYEFCFRNSNSELWFATHLDSSKSWPMSQIKIHEKPVQLVTGREQSETNIGRTSTLGATLENIYFNSNGFAVKLDELHPWTFRQDIESDAGQICFGLSSFDDPLNPNNPYPKEFVEHMATYNTIKFHILVSSELRLTYQNMFNKYEYIRRPKIQPNFNMIEFPNIQNEADPKVQNDSIKLAANSNKIGLQKSFKWQFNIMEHDKTKISDAKMLVENLKSLEHNISITFDSKISISSVLYKQGKTYFLRQLDENKAVLDYSNNEAIQWYAEELNKLRHEYGIQSFIFINGDVNIFQTTYKLFTSSLNFNDEMVKKYPNFATTRFVQTCSLLGDSVIVGAGFKSQRYPVFVKLDSLLVLIHEEGTLKSMMIDYLTLSIAGYAFIMPDIIDPMNQVSDNLYIRWIQLTTLMPVMNIALNPWNRKFSDSVSKSIVKMLKLRKKFSTKIQILVDRWIDFGEPIIRPMWYVNNNMKECFDQFMLGDSIMVAPILNFNSTKRMVILPSGNWKDQNKKTYRVIENKKSTEIDVPIDELLYFERIEIIMLSFSRYFPRIGRLSPRISTSFLRPRLFSDSTTDSAEQKLKPINLEELSEETEFDNKLRRAILYVPGNDQRKIEKVKTIANEVDSIVLDCEDGVAINKKEEARHTILKTLDQIKPVSVRINSIDSGLAEDDLKTILLPKVENKTHIDQFLDLLQNALKNRPEPNVENDSEKKKKKKSDPTQDMDTIDLIIYTETAKGLLELKEICNHSIEMAEFTKCRLAGIVFGSDDFYANIGATRSNDCREVLFARQMIVLTAKAFNLQAIDVVNINFKDLEQLRMQSEEGAAMGFTGKQAIHPAQIPVIQAAFCPTEAKIEWAKSLVAGFEQAQREGKGAFVFRGQMIDMPLLRQAYNVIKCAQKINKA
ncbi:hypothetical protein BLOT_008712 [Blomia tropicalis]|nr:hypothetical protein BLOT_008712 [Blomia tropicalis]